MGKEYDKKNGVEFVPLTNEDQVTFDQSIEGAPQARRYKPQSVCVVKEEEKKIKIYYFDCSLDVENRSVWIIVYRRADLRPYISEICNSPVRVSDHIKSHRC